ncbi:MAG: T9SS type A sorting domain-containing protein, partial [Deltaproteobacteria bacterium]|nr:T9SS type A sorting domain-containing protein [Deltaproteobacteria bacterium]
IPYELEKESPVSIEIYNATGQLVRTLELGRQLRGRYISKSKAVYWDGRSEFGERAASGVYFYVLKAGDFVSVRKMVILK